MSFRAYRTRPVVSILQKRETFYNMLQDLLLTHQILLMKVKKRAKIRNRYNQEPHLNQDTNGKETTSQPDTAYESQEVSPFPGGNHKASINRLARKNNKNKTEIT